MKRVVGILVVSLLSACGADQEAAVTASESGLGTLELAATDTVASGSFTRGDDVVAFSSTSVGGIFEVDVTLNGLTLDALLDPAQGVSALDGFASANGADTQLVDEDRELLASLYAALNEQYPTADVAQPLRYLRRAVGLWAQHPSTVELTRTVMGEEGRGYTMLCSYAKCGGYYTGSCSSWNYYYYAKHDCNWGGFDNTHNQQIAQLGDHYSCSGDEYYWTGSYWKCGEPDHWIRPKVVGNCFGRCGGGCGGDTQYTLDATNHDGCVRNGHALASLYCDDQFASASDDELFAPDCY